jgi:predicted membrane-bound spermidine synthase
MLSCAALRAESRVVLLAGPPFLLSGAAAIVFEVAWQRLLVLPSGIGTFSVSVVVAAFMAGLGIGSLLGGLLSVRLEPRAALRGFALVELGVAGFACASPFLYYDILYLRASWLYGSLPLTAIAHFLSLLVPTTLMGMSLPLLVRATVRETATAPRTIGLLYGVNLAGAAVGALATPWLLLRHLGIEGAIWSGAACNVLAGLTAFAVSAGAWDTPPAGTDERPGPEDGEAPGSRPFSLWLILYGLSGFCALSLEILWFRVVDVGVKSTAFTFGTVLALYLLGLACGSLYGTTRAARVKRPLQTFLVCQCLVALFAGLAVTLLARIPVGFPVYSWLHDYWGRDEELILGSASALGPVLTLYALFPAFLYLVPTLLMGFSFPVLQRAVQDDPRTAGRRTGVLQAANILGCVAGSLLVGLVLLGTLGTTGTLRLVVACGLGFAILGTLAYGLGRPFAPLGLALLALLFALPDQRGLWLRLHGTARPESLLLEDDTGVVALVPQRAPRWLVYVKGAAHSWLPYGGIHSLLGGIPAAVHPAPRDVAIIGLGSGETAWAAGCRGETRSITVFETAAPQQGLLRELARRERQHGLAGLLQDPRLGVVTADGRFALQQGDARYDVIEMDALTPYLGYSGNVYSVEFFRLCAARLKPGGLLCSWAPTPRVRHAILATFPHVLGFEDESVLVASGAPLAVDHGLWARRLEDPATTRYLGEAVRDEIVQALRHASVPRAPTGPAMEMNHDLFPADEFLKPLRRPRRG